MSPIKQLLKISGDLVNALSADEEREAAQQLLALCLCHAQLTDQPRHADTQATMLVQGEAIAPLDAARCILDFRRTAVFLRGIMAAVRTLQSRFPHTRLEILYAGCGPCATLALPLMTQLRADEIAFTLLDIHQRSLTAARQLIETFGLQSYVRDYVQADATSHVTHQRFHLIVTETMQRALSKEPQVAIAMHLVNQLEPDGIMIPTNVSVTAQLCDLSREFQSQANAEHIPVRVSLGEVFALNAQGCRELSAKELLLSRRTVQTPAGLTHKLSMILTTKITVFDSFVLTDYESGLTFPLWLSDLHDLPEASRIEFWYETGQRPGLRYQVVSR